MVKKIDKSNKQNVKVKQKQNVNVRVHIDQRDTKKKPRKKRSNIPSTKKEGVSSFSSSSYTPVYIQSGNPYPNYHQPPEVAPIKVPVSQEVHTLVNPPITSTTNLIQEVQRRRSISPIPLSFGEENTPLLSESGMHGKGIMHYNPSTDNSKFPSNPLNSDILKRREEIIENRNMGNDDINVEFGRKPYYKKLPDDIQKIIKAKLPKRTYRIKQQIAEDKQAEEIARIEKRLERDRKAEQKRIAKADKKKKND
jgi:hypothetical protein